jgi:hypothetical protein
LVPSRSQPPGYKIEFSEDENKPRVQLKYPPGMTGPQPQGFAQMNAAHAAAAVQAQVQQPVPLSVPHGAAGVGPVGYDRMGGQPMDTAPPGPPAAPANKKAPIEFDQAINYVTKIKTRFAKQPETYKAFLEILHTYQKEQKTIKEVYEQVSHLFKSHTDLLSEFSQFLPDGSPEAGGLLGGPKGKGKGGLLGPPMGGMGGGLKQPVAQRPGAKGGAPMGGPSGPRPVGPVEEEDERFWQKRRNGPGGGPPPPGRKDESKRVDAAARSPEAEFFSKCRNRMPKPLYLELLKCLNLYSQQVLDRSELLTLVHDLFKRSQFELFGTFRKLLGYSGGVEQQTRDVPSPPATSSAPMAEGGNFRELDFTTMRRHGTSYRQLPDTHPVPPSSGRGPLETLVLNDTWVSVATGTEDLNFKTLRKNQYEECIFRAEDERFELDTTIETNQCTLTYLSTISLEIERFSEQEKRRYKLPQVLSAMHCKSIRRLYGAQGAQVIEMMHKCPAAAVAPLLTRLRQKDEEWRELRRQCGKTWKEVYEKNYTKALDHRSFYFKQGDKKNFSGKQMVMELKALCENADGENAAALRATLGDEETSAAAAAAANKAAGASGEGSLPPLAPPTSLTLPFTVKAATLAELHNDTLALMTFGAKLNFSVVEGDIDEKLRAFWKNFVRKFFVCPDADAEVLARKASEGGAADGTAAGTAAVASDSSAGAADAMDVDPQETTPPRRHKPLLIVSADVGEEAATRDARPPESRWLMPLSYSKTSHQKFIGNSHFYIFVRLYHIILMRLDAAKDMAAKAAKEYASRQITDAEAAASKADAAAASSSAANGVDEASAEALNRASELQRIRDECKGDMYLAFISCLRQLIDGKMEASAYEDVLRTLLGTNAYSLFTLHKVISQALKQLQMLLVEEASQTLLELYTYERCRALPGSLSEGTYRSNARMVLEGDDCFCMDQLYAAGGVHGGALVLSFLPEKEDLSDDDDVEEGEDEDEDEEDEVAKAEAAELTKSFVLVTREKRSRMLLRRTASTKQRRWDATVLRNGLESRIATSTCKLRFVYKTEDVWFSNTKRKAATRAKRSSTSGGSGAKRQKLSGFMEARLSRDGAGAINALAGGLPPKRAPLPSHHVLKPLDLAPAAVPAADKAS